ncbi:MAG: hypothetical protein ACREUU_03870, partial [Gammaproteobacteria bacterium]
LTEQNGACNGPSRSGQAGRIKLGPRRLPLDPCQTEAIAHNPSMKRICPCALLLAFSLTSLQVSAAPSAEAVLSKARTQAAKEGKKIFLNFDASW